MEDIRYAGVLIGVGILAYAIYKYRRGTYRRFDFLIASVIALGVGLLSAFPSVATILTRALGLQNRLFATLVFTNVIMFGLFLYVLNKANQANRNIGELVRALARNEFDKTYDLEDPEDQIAIVIPAFNEEQAIEGVLKQIPDRLLGLPIRPIVVVDGGEDNTAEVVRRGNYLVASHAMNRGQGDALRTGFEIARKTGASAVVTMDADGQHQAADLEKLLKPIIENEADFVIGSRFLGSYEDRGSIRHVGILFFTALINFFGRIRITDCTNGFRAIRVSRLADLDLKEDRFNAPELLMEAAKKRLRIHEVPVTIAGRAAGNSKKPARLGYPLGFLATTLKVWLRQ